MPWRRSEGGKWNVEGEGDERLNVFKLLSFNFFCVNTVVFNLCLLTLYFHQAPGEIS